MTIVGIYGKSLLIMTDTLQVAFVCFNITVPSLNKISFEFQTCSVTLSVLNINI